MQRPVRAAAILVCFFALIAPLPAQHRVDPRNMYERVMMIVPMTGTGSFEDPVRPMYTPLPSAFKAAAASRTHTGILGFTFVLSDDGQHALVEFVAKDRTAFQQILADSSVKSFLKGRDKREDIETEFKKYKKDFDFTHFGVRMP
jgi:hypothetical protein